MYAAALIIHVLAATIWTGGHLVLALGILPGALRERSPVAIEAFEGRFEKVGIPALLLQVASGLYLATLLAPDPGSWLAFDTPATRAIALKLGFLLATALLAADARLRIIPRLSAETLPGLAWHIVAVTALSVAFVVVGVGYRVGLLS